jgi:eukaryotic-like serine/threonine-protein kinase
MTVEAGLIIAGKYRLVAPIATGGMGAVWRARHETLETAATMDSALERFKREARAAAQLKSPNVVQIIDYGIHDEIPYIVMELLEGEDLGVHLAREGTLSLGRAAMILRSAAKALRLAHDAGLVHRDLKPANIFIARIAGEEVIKVLDFGIAKEKDQKLATIETSNNALLGSPLYMSPEQTRGSAVDHRSDLWSLAVVLLEMITGDVPFSGASLGDVFVKICTGPIPPPSKMGVFSPGLDGFFERALDRDPTRRFATASELAGAFEAIVRPIELGAGVTAKLEAPIIAAAAITNRAEDKTPLRGREADTLAASSAHAASLVTPEPTKRPRALMVGFLVATGIAGLGAVLFTVTRGPVEGAASPVAPEAASAAVARDTGVTTVVTPATAEPSGSAPGATSAGSASASSVSASSVAVRKPIAATAKTTSTSVVSAAPTQNNPTRDPIFGLPNSVKK